MSDTTQAVEKTPAQNKLATTGKATTMDLLKGDAFKERIMNALPKHLTADRMIAVALTCINKTPKLAQCDQNSFFKAMLDLSQLGLEPDGRRAHLIPFDVRDKTTHKVIRTDVQLIIDYKGLVDLAMRSGQVSNIHADVVCDNDVFEYDMGEVKQHRIDFKKDRGAMYAVYSICTFKDGSKKSEVMGKDDVDKIRARSPAGKSGPWVTDYCEMAKKTVFRRLSKWLPLSPEFRDALDKDDDRMTDITKDIRSPSPLAGVALPETSQEQPEHEPEAATTSEDSAPSHVGLDSGTQAPSSDDNPY